MFEIFEGVSYISPKSKTLTQFSGLHTELGEYKQTINPIPLVSIQYQCWGWVI